ncbi:DOCK9-like protein [Mya arenaria]|uniref:DOCK9-like protein n=1 Tax=Mya arenaria TaxID=6604 RepID=A0ABY7G5N8_MYAAR|nr:DOCK9-like protein [Mya arenaria]
MKDLSRDISDFGDICQTKIVVTGVNGSDLVPLRLAHFQQTPLNSYDRKRVRRERNLKRMLKEQAKSGNGFNGMVSAIMEMATNSSDIVDKSLLELYRQNRPKPVEPIDYETYVLKNKVLLHNDPHRDLLNFPYDDILTPKSGNLLVEECLQTYTDTCHMVRFRYSKYSGGYQQLPSVKKREELQEQVYEVDQEADDREDTISRTYSSASMTQPVITKAGWLYKGPDSSKDTIMSFTRQFKRRYFVIKQQSDQTYSLEFFKDDRRSEAKGNSKKGKHGFELRTQEKAYLFAAESEVEMEDWIMTLNKVRNAAETLSNISLDRLRGDEPFSPSKVDDKAFENMVHPELQKYAKESESMMLKARQDNRQNLFNVYGSIVRNFHHDPEDDEDVASEVDVFPQQFGERFMLRLLEFKLKLQVNMAEEGNGKKQCNEIEAMIPADLVAASDKLNKVDGKSTAPELKGLEENWLLAKNKQIYLYVRIEKVLQGPISQSIEPYLRGADSKTGSKVYRQMKQFCSHIGHHRMPFAWSARPLATSNVGPYEMPLYKQDSSKMSEDEVIKHLQDLKRPEKQSKWTSIPGTFKISLHPIKPDPPLPNTVTSSFVPVKPFPTPPADPIAIEIEEFVPAKGQFNSPFDSYVNNLYVYPLSLKYDSQKSFTKARNISCCVEIRDSDEEHAVPLKCVYGRLGPSVFTSVASSCVLHHSQTPEYTEEVKVLLPTILHEKHHLLFRFYHVSCEGSKGSTKKRDGIEVPVGYAWVPLLHSTGRVEVGERTVQVATNLPARYLGSESLSSRNSTASDVKWVDGGKPLFKLKLHLMSTVYTRDPHLHTFFFHCQKMMTSPSPGPDSLNKLKVLEKVSNVADAVEQQYLMNSVKSLHAVDVSTYIQFLPTILNILFKLVANTQSEDIGMNAVRVVIHIVSEVQDVDKQELLEKYVKYIFRAEPIPKGSKQKTVHEELAKSLTMILRPANADQVVVVKFLNNAWFFFQVLIKSMTQFLVDGERVKMPRNERFSSDYQYKLQTLIQTITPYITSKYKEAPRETRNANFSLAYFVKMCFTLMDRGVVFQLIAQHINTFAVVEHRCDYTLSEEYRKTHYLPGLLLQELKLALNESKETRRCAINVLRDQFAKHAFDDRYSQKSHQGRIAALYLPLIQVLLDNKHRLVKSDDKNQQKNQSPNHSASQPSMNGLDSSLVGQGGPGSVSAKSEAKSTSSGHLNVEDLKSHISGSSSSIASSNSSTDTKTDSGSRDKGHSRQGSVSTVIPGVTSSATSKVYQYQRLDNTEIHILLGWFNNSSEYDIVDFFSLLELCLEHFKYQGKKKIVTLAIIGESSMGRKTNTMPVKRQSAIPTANGSLPPTFRSVSQYGDFVPDVPSYHMTTSSEADGLSRARSEANMSTEMGIIVLDVLGVYTDKFKTDLSSRDGDNTLMETVFDLYLYFLRTSQSETLQTHVFAVWRNFVRKFSNVLFKGDATLCSKLCYEESLALINSYAHSDKTMNKTRFSSEVKDLTKRIKTVLMATAQMKEHQNDPEMLIDLQYSLAISYASTPELRKTWLESMARIHSKQGNHSEETLVTFMEEAATCLESAERFEVLGEVYKLIIPMYERAREFEKLAQCYQILANSYTKSYFDEEDGKQYIYKEPKVTSLAELCDRLKALYEGKFGRDNVRLIMDSKTVSSADIDNRYAYIQVTHVTPFFKEKELQRRLTDFEKNNNINQFMFETPFTKSGKAHGDIQDQYKRRTVLHTSHSLPFVKKRIEVVDKKECILSPIEVAIDAMNAKVADLREVVDLALPDMKKLQLKLQGSVSAQVNAGPLAYAEAFLSEDHVASYPPDRVEALKNIFRDFVRVCNDSLDLNAKLITTEQKEYHESLKDGFEDIVSQLSKMFGETVLTKESEGSQRGNMVHVSFQKYTFGFEF